ncbi:ADP-ribosylation/crystallin J1 [Alisedimentitalea sp. MJ-SS2]|uniref:ADP-ribosylation/crystallin J1 n=1 Tax=Aliisedimentitalea sp. MJ-SS2 TaxID=3049795 RepID=UPI00290F368E|nr:ADP-ribosylation/crystallin J1 [Alisedimentitalea sp. MJ-SS2]MDU8926691.1 ADP-ribosylation/crystallin J1 [Alisedimentitalea sp. MJ-SS2]
MILYRPTGLKELLLVRDSGWKEWPPRLPDQPIFYPVTTFDYAEKIARDWNSVTPVPDNLGFVTRWEMSDDIIEAYPLQLAGGRDHEELWVPAEDMEVFNERIVGEIEVIAAYRDKAPIDLNEAQPLWQSS